MKFLSNSRLVFLILSVLLIVSKLITLFNFSFIYTGNDDLIFWQIANDYSQGIFHEPFMYGQNYNYAIESLFAVPLLKLGIPLAYAMPITTMWMSVLPFLLFAIGFYRKKWFLASYIFLTIPVLMPIEYDIITTITRGFINGLFFSSFLIFPLLNPNKISSFIVFGLFASLGFVTNPNSILVAFPIGLYLFFTNFKNWKFYVFTVISMTPTLVAYYFSKQFYLYQPDFVVHEMWDLNYATTRVWETINHLDRSFAYLTPVTWGIHWLILPVIMIGSLFMIKKDWRLGLSILFGMIFLIFSLGINKVEEGVDSIFFSPTRMFLGVPILLALTIAWFFRNKWNPKIALVIVAFSIVFVSIKLFSVESVVERHTAIKNYGPVSIKEIKKICDDCEEIKGLTDMYNPDCLIFIPTQQMNVPEISFLNFGCELLLDDFTPSFMMHKERRTWIYREKIKSTPSTILFVNYEAHKQSLQENIFFEYEILDEMENILLIKNNTLTINDIANVLSLPIEREK